MEEGYINTRRKSNRRYDWKPNTEPHEDDTDVQPSQVHKEEEEEVLDLIAAFPDEMLELIERVNRGEMTEEELLAIMDSGTARINEQ